MKIRPAKVEELEEIAHLQHIVFRPDEPESVDRYLSYTQDDPTYTLEHSRVIEVDGQIVAHLRIWDRILLINGVEILAAGIGSLCVHAQYRKRGYAQALMHDSEAYFLQAGYDLGLLFTIIGTPFYKALNWVSIPLPTFDFGALNMPRESVGTRRLDVAQDLEDVMHIHQANVLNDTGSVIRDITYWTAGPARIRSVFPKWGAVHNDQVVAYVNFEADDVEVWIKEVGALPGHHLAYADLASVVLNHCKGKNLMGSLPRQHPFVHTLETLSQSSATWDVDDHMMVKGINRNTLRDKLGPDVVPTPHPASEEMFWMQIFSEAGFYWDTDVF